MEREGKMPIGRGFISKDETRSSTSLREFSAFKLAKLYLHRRNIIIDNVFTSNQLQSNYLDKKQFLLGQYGQKRVTETHKRMQR
ncbi:piggyBac transposable element-derived protein 4-like [Vespula maculifrons]|uniref:PiggyBac transposable element-derived protein 4-like n=1 Tax=Vespula maculifrons TaxID=7453 RepID=A0ABD2BHL3_VESMC